MIFDELQVLEGRLQAGSFDKDDSQVAGVTVDTFDEEPAHLFDAFRRLDNGDDARR